MPAASCLVPMSADFLPLLPQCYGFVTFDSSADAEGVLEFAQSQGVWADDRMLRINWAQGSMPEWKVGGRWPARKKSVQMKMPRA